MFSLGVSRLAITRLLQTRGKSREALGLAQDTLSRCPENLDDGTPNPIHAFLRCVEIACHGSSNLRARTDALIHNSETFKSLPIDAFRSTNIGISNRLQLSTSPTIAILSAGLSAGLGAARRYRHCLQRYSQVSKLANLDIGSHNMQQLQQVQVAVGAAGGKAIGGTEAWGWQSRGVDRAMGWTNIGRSEVGSTGNTVE